MLHVTDSILILLFTLSPSKINLMRIILASFVLIIGTVIGVNAINTVSNIQDAKMTRFCKSVPVGASYDEMCKDFR